MKKYTQFQIANAVYQTFGRELEDYPQFWTIINTTPPLPTECAPVELSEELKRDLQAVAVSIHNPAYSAPEDQIVDTVSCLEKAMQHVIRVRGRE